MFPTAGALHTAFALDVDVASVDSSRASVDARPPAMMSAT
jgi:hypothetical protein